MDDKEVTHPDHYTWLPGVECQKVVQHFNFNKGNALKYLWRAGRKNADTELVDLKKARQYIDFEISRLLLVKQGESYSGEKPVVRHYNTFSVTTHPQAGGGDNRCQSRAPGLSLQCVGIKDHVGVHANTEMWWA